MAKKMNLMAWISLLITVIFVVLYGNAESDMLLSSAITHKHKFHIPAGAVTLAARFFHVKHT